MDRMVRQTAALLCVHAAALGVVVEPALAKEIALDVHVDIEAPLGYQCVTADVLNVRAGPDADHRCLFQIPEGQRVEVWGRLEGWGFVLWDEGEGWVSDDYLADCPDALLEESPKASYTFPGLDVCINTGRPVPEPSSEAFHAALELDTDHPTLVTYDHDDVLVGVVDLRSLRVKQPARGRLRLLVNRCLQRLGLQTR